MKEVRQLQVGDILTPTGKHIMSSKATVYKKYNTHIMITYDIMPDIHVHWPYPKLALCFTWEGKE